MAEDRGEKGLPPAQADHRVAEGGKRVGDAVDGFFGIVLLQRVIGIGVAGVVCATIFSAALLRSSSAAVTRSL